MQQFLGNPRCIIAKDSTVMVTGTHVWNMSRTRYVLNTVSTESVKPESRCARKSASGIRRSRPTTCCRATWAWGCSLRIPAGGTSRDAHSSWNWRHTRQEAELCTHVLCDGLDQKAHLVGKQNLGRRKHCHAIVQFTFLVPIQHGLLVGRDILVDVENASLQQLQRVFHTLAPLLTFLCFGRK